MGQIFGQVRRENHSLLVRGFGSPKQDHALPGIVPKVDGMAAIGPCVYERRGIRTAALWRRTDQARLDPPPDVIVSAIPSRCALVLADGKVDAAARAHQLFRDLGTRCACTDHQNAPVRKLRRPAIVGGVKLHGFAVTRRHPGNDGALKGSSRNDDIARAQWSFRCLQKIRAARISQRQPRHRNPLPYRGCNEGRIAFKEIGNLGSGCKTIGIVVDERVAGKTYEQIGRLEMETVPPLGSPALRDPATFDD